MLSGTKMNSEKRIREKPIRTGSIAFRIGLSSGFNLLLIFIALDIVLFGIFLWPQISGGTGAAEITADSFNDLMHLLREWKLDIVLRLEGLMVVLWVLFETLKVRKKLRPLQQFADAALKLSEMDGEAEQRYQKLENAIDMLSPAEEDQKLVTGDAELEGLETAVNKLMARMRDSYRQQARFVSDASHELRTPIAVIKGYADLLDRWGKTDEKILEEMMPIPTALREAVRYRYAETYPSSSRPPGYSSRMLPNTLRKEGRSSLEVLCRTGILPFPFRTAASG